MGTAVVESSVFESSVEAMALIVALVIASIRARRGLLVEGMNFLYMQVQRE